MVQDNDQLFQAAEYAPRIVAYKNGAPVRLSDVATVVDRVEDVHAAGVANGKPSVLIIIFRQPGANIIGTVDQVRALKPQLQASIPPTIKMSWWWTGRRRSGVGARCRRTLRSSVISVILVMVFCSCGTCGRR